MDELELPSLVIESVAATSASARPILINRDPAPDEAGVPINATISFELVDAGFGGIDVGATRVFLDGDLVFDGRPSPLVEVTESADTLALILHPRAVFASLASVEVRVVSATRSGHRLDASYRFTVEDRTAPRLLAAQAIGQQLVRLAFDEPVQVVDLGAIELAPIDLPAVPIRPVATTGRGTLLDITLDTEMSADRRYEVRAAGVADQSGNLALPPHDRATFTGFRPPRRPEGRFDVWSMLPRHNRRIDTTDDLARFIACLQDVTDLLLADLDRFPDLFDLERAPEDFVDAILADLGNPFTFELTTLEKRRLAAVLVEMYRQKGTAAGIRNVVRFLLGIDLEAIEPIAASTLVLGESLLGVDWELGPSDRRSLYTFDIRVRQVLTSREREQLLAIVDYMRPAHTHLGRVVEPSPPSPARLWILGESLLAEETVLA